MIIKAVIFDLDGTLLNTLDDLADSVNELMNKYDFPVHPIENYKKFVGSGAEMLVKRAIPKNLTDKIDIKNLTKEVREIYSKRLLNKTKPYDGIYNMLDELQKRYLPLNVLSNKPDRETNILVEHFFKKYNFQNVIGASDRFPKKPEPAGALFISAAINIIPQSFAYLGDSDVDMETANNAGMFPIGVLWGFRDKGELLTNNAQKLLSNPMELIDFLYN
ncbi:MAG: HAD family hydrolase [Spirochaetes bacterium]|nr:HAD family hydrolase [Spirochaetota bacterium]